MGRQTFYSAGPEGKKDENEEKEEEEEEAGKQGSEYIGIHRKDIP